MAQALAMVHDVDPRQKLLDEVADKINQVTPLGSSVLVAVYRRPTITMLGGNKFYIPDKTADEDDYQGKVGLVLRLGPIAFQDDASHRFGEAIPKMGDWILYNVGETWPFELGNTRCRIVEDVAVRAIIDHPDIAW